MKKTVFYTLGCRANQYQTEVLKSQLITNDFQTTTFGEKADLYIINTCLVTQDAARKSRQAIRKALRLGKKVIVAGCYSRLEGKEIKKLFPTVEITDINPMVHHSPLIVSRVRANLMIQDGCEHFCSYCIVPYARGKIVSKPLKQIYEEAKQLVTSGVREIILSGINLGTYGKNTDTALPDVLQELSKIDNLYRIRLSSIEPMYLTKKLVDTVAQLPKVCHHFHLPLQSGDNNILKAMNRNYQREDYLDMVNYIRSKISDCAITTDIIVGFPGEGEKEFENTVNLVNQVKFSRIHIFPFSKRDGTPAAKFSHQVDQNTKRKRAEILNELRTKYMYEFAQKYQGKPVEILVEKKGEGLTSNYIRVKYLGKKSEIGTLKNVIFKGNFKEK